MENYNFEAYVKKTNKIFEKATLAEKRVMIAKDTILRIKKKNINPSNGDLLATNLYSESDESFKTLLNNNQISCTVCAKGGLFCSYIGRVNKATVSDIIEIEDSSTDNEFSYLHRQLLKIFTLQQLDLIETAFEGESFLETPCNKTKAVTFYMKYKTAEERLLAICENIVENEGTFKP